MNVNEIGDVAERMRSEIRKVVIGHDEVVELLLTSLLAAGHVLLEGVPGTAKTLLTQAFAAALSLPFGRIQFTPDLMPGDVLGTNLFNFNTNTFTLTKGPIFTQLLLADEINRSPPKTQSALLQAMNERAVTIDGTTYELGTSFMVIATENPIEQQGTYPLPEAQLDRFLFKVRVSYPEREQEIEVVLLHGRSSAMPRLGDFALTPVVGPDTLDRMRSFVAQVTLTDALARYIVDLVRATRTHSAFEVGASTRAATMLATASRALAVLHGRDFVVPDDIKRLLVPTLEHRVVLAATAEMEGLDASTVLRHIADQTEAPR